MVVKLKFKITTIFYFLIIAGVFVTGFSVYNKKSHQKRQDQQALLEYSQTQNQILSLYQDRNALFIFELAKLPSSQALKLKDQFSKLIEEMDSITFKSPQEMKVFEIQIERSHQLIEETRVILVANHQIWKKLSEIEQKIVQERKSLLVSASKFSQKNQVFLTQFQADITAK